MISFSDTNIPYFCFQTPHVVHVGYTQDILVMIPFHFA